MPGATADKDRRESRDKTKAVEVTADARLTQQRDAIIEQRKNILAANSGAIRDLEERHQGLAAIAAERDAGAAHGQTSDVDTKRMADLQERQVASLQADRASKLADLADAAKSIEALRRTQDAQRQRLDAAATRPGADLAGIEKSRASLAEQQAQQQQRATELTAELRGALARRELSQDTFRRAERDGAAAVARSPEADADRERRYDQVRDETAVSAREQDKVADAEVVAVKQQLDALRYRVDAETVGRLRQQLDPALKEALRTTDGSQARLSDDAYRRVAAIILAERERTAQATTDSAAREQAALEHAKGQLFEEIVSALLKAEVDAANARPGAERRRVIDGDGIRTDDQKKLSDAMIVKDAAEGHVRLDEAWEAKAGFEAAKELSRRKLDLSENDRREAMQQAIDIELDRRWEQSSGRQVAGTDANAVEATMRTLTDKERLERTRWEQQLSNDQMADALIAAQEEVDRLLSSKVQTEAGQPEQLRERVRAMAKDQQARFFEEGRSRTIDNDRGIRIRTAVPSDVHEAMREAQRAETRRIEIASTRLRELAEAIKKQLRDDRYW